MQTEHTPDVHDPRRENLIPHPDAKDEPHWRTMHADSDDQHPADPVERMRREMQRRSRLAGAGESQIGDGGA